MKNNIGEYKKAISDEVVDSLRDFMDSAEEFQTSGKIGGDEIDRTVKDSEDLNVLDQRPNYGDKMLKKVDNMYNIILPKLSKELDNVLVKYLKEESVTDLDTLYVITNGGNDEEILRSFYSAHSFWNMDVLMQKYHKGIQGFHAWHKDQGDSVPHMYRTHVVMFYLNDVEKGGETEFYNQKVKVKPEKGKVVIFPTAGTHLHRGNIPESDDKYICNFWILQGRGDTLPTIGEKWNLETDLPNE